MTHPPRGEPDIGVGAGSIPVVDATAVPVLTAAQMRRVAELVVDQLGIGLLQMMENAGRALADLAITRFAPSSVTVMAGTGNNGGGGLAAARHLVNRGVAVSVVLAAPPAPGTAAHAQLRAARACGATMVDRPASSDLVIDALVGYGLTGPLRGRTAELARWALDRDAPVLALDAPSGLDPTTGAADASVIRAAATLTLALPKAGLIDAQEVGELYLADISVPRTAYAVLGVEVPEIFDRAPVVRLRQGADPVHALAGDTPLAWRTPLDAVRLILTGATFATGARIALVVGTLLTVVNLGGTFTSGEAGPATALQAAANYLIPYVVSSLGVLSRTRIRVDDRPS